MKAKPCPYHLAALEFDTFRVPREPEYETKVHFEAPRAFMEALSKRGITNPCGVLRMLKRAVAAGPATLEFQRLQGRVSQVAERWHAFLPTQMIESRMDEAEADALATAAEQMGLPPAVVYVAAFFHFTDLNLDEIAPRYVWPDRLRAIPPNALIFPGVPPRGNRRHRLRQHA